MEGYKVPNLHHNPGIPWQAQVREPMYGVNLNESESERQSQAEMEAQQREDRLKQRRIRDKARRSLMTEQEKEAVREKKRNAYHKRKVGFSGDEKKAVNEAADTSTGRPHLGATRKADDIPSIVSVGGSEVSSLPQSPKIPEQAQHRVDEGKSTRSTDIEPKEMTEIVNVVEPASLYLMFFQTAPDEKSRSCKFCGQSYPIKTAYGNLGRHLKYRHPGYDKMGDAVSSPSPQPAAAMSEKVDMMGDAIPSLLPQPITSVKESAEKKGDAVPSPSAQLIRTETNTSNSMSDAIYSPLFLSVSTVSEVAQSQVKHSRTDHESCKNEHTS
ncbi:hypothetical protein MKW94_021801 [Papaver nudicaule]|uniref:Uncharacterized protein n=1 Tax=Papaver nudicaule TaxID=74823 RepID=A0AA41V1U5_PAPNU|nr:hypothetical protein [Papaver nudicaule]